MPLQRVQIHEDEYASESARLHGEIDAADRAAEANHRASAVAYRADVGDFGAVTFTVCMRVTKVQVLLGFHKS